MVLELYFISKICVRSTSIEKCKIVPKLTTTFCPGYVNQLVCISCPRYFKHILEQNVSSEKISLQADGSYKPFQPKVGNESILTLDDTFDRLAPDDEKPHSAGGEEPHCTNDMESQHSCSEKSLHTTIDLLDDSSVSNSEMELPDLRGTECGKKYLGSPLYGANTFCLFIYILNY